MNTLGYGLLELLKAKDMTQKELAYTIGVSEVSISRYVNNARKPRTMVLYKMAEVLGVSAEYLLTGNKKEEYGKWIPCSERLPEDNTDVIVCFYSGIVTEMRYWENGNFQGIYEHTTKSIVAWMPLPKPYKGE